MPIKPQTPEQVFERAIEEAQNADVFRKRTQTAIKWYLGWIRNMAIPTFTRASFTKRSRFRSTFKVGQMYCYVYDAKTKATLPYWDKFPLVFPVGPSSDGKGWFGLNLHYIPLQYRPRILSSLYKIITNKKYDETTRLKLSYDYLKNLSGLDGALTKVAFKKYLTSRLRSKLVYIAPDEWPIALFLPMAQWQKSGARAVMSDIDEQIKKLRR